MAKPSKEFTELKNVVQQCSDPNCIIAREKAEEIAREVLRCLAQSMRVWPFETMAFLKRWE